MAGTRVTQISEVECVEYHHDQMRLQVCTLVRLDSVQTEMTAQFQQMLTMLQQGQVRQRSSSLSMHSQVEPADFKSQTTRVGEHPRLQLHTNGYRPQVVADTTTSMVTFSILSPDASLSYDRIKLRLEEYRTLLASDSDTIELSTMNGKTVICRKQANEMEEYLDQAEILLQNVVQSRDISTLVVLHHLRDLAEVLDNLKLYDECRLTGNCALDLAEALVRRSLEFRQEQAETLALVAGLSVYQPRARTLFIQAVSICEEVVANNASHSNKIAFLFVLGRAGSSTWDRLSTYWLERAIQLMTLMTKEDPPRMVHPNFRRVIYYNYGNCLDELKQYSDALEAYRVAISICRTLDNNNPAKSNPHPAGIFMNMGITLQNLGKYDDAIVAYKEALDICTTMPAQDPLQYNDQMAKTLLNYGDALEASKQVSEAAVVKKQAVSIYRDLARAGNECTDSLCYALHSYGRSCYLLGQHAEAVLVYQESILLRRALAAANPEEEIYLIVALHNIANSFHALGKHADANAAANEALERNHGKVNRECDYAPDFKACFVCQRGTIPDSLQNDLPPLPSLQAVSSPRPVEDPGVDASLVPAETPKPTGETANIPVRRKRDKILGWFRGNRAR